jgi:ribonuclease BN (tRNA processing enzyme)
MKLIVLGSGTSTPYKRRGSSGYALILPSSLLLLDCGNGVTWKLEAVGLDFLEIDHVFLTHMHPDHTSDLITLLFATKYSYRKPRAKPLNIWGPVGLYGLFEGFTRSYGKWVMPEGVHKKEIEAGVMGFDGFEVRILGMLHGEASLGYRIESEGKSIAYTGDTDYCEAAVELASGVDLLIIECSVPDVYKIEGHLTPKDVSRIVDKARPKRVVLTHIYPEADEVDIVGEIREGVDADIIKAEDMMELVI